MRYVQAMTLALLVILSGCGGHENRPAPAGTGSVTIAVQWPERTGEMAPRLLPEASNSLEAEVVDNGGALVSDVLVITRPETQGTLEDVPAGEHTLRVVAYPTADASGVAQARAEKTITVQAGQTGPAERITLLTTIDQIDITPETPSVKAEETIALTATAKDASDQTVLVRPDQPFTWTVESGAAYASIGQYTGVVQAIAEGTATVRATEQETGKSATATVNVQAWGREKWRFTAPESFYSSPAIGSDGAIYVGCWDDNVYAINPDGTELWRFAAGFDVLSSPALGPDGIVYVGCRLLNLYAINPGGTERWRFTTRDRVHSTPAIAADGTIYVGSWDNNVYAVKPDGTEKWRFVTGDHVWSSAAVGPAGVIFIGSYDGYLYALNPNGTERWRFPTGERILSSPAIGSDGTIYIGSHANKLYAINPNGTEKWHFTAGDWVGGSPAIGHDGTICAGSWDGKLYGINPNGTEKWQFEAGAVIYSSPAIAADGTVYVGCRDGNLYAVGPDGTEKWHIQTSESQSASFADNSPVQTSEWKSSRFTDSSPAIGPDGTIYVGSNDNNLYAIEVVGATPQLASSAWPMFHHDLSHTGRYGAPLVP